MSKEGAYGSDGWWRCRYHGAFFQNFNYIRHSSGTLQTLTSFGLTDTVFLGGGLGLKQSSVCSRRIQLTLLALMAGKLEGILESILSGGRQFKRYH